MRPQEFSIQLLPPGHLLVTRCATMGRYLADAIRQTVLSEQVWLVSVDDEGTPHGRVCCYAGENSEGTTYLRQLLLAMLRPSATRFIIVHYGLGHDAARELAALLVCKALRRVEALAGFVVIDYIVANNVDGTVAFRSLSDDG